MQYVIKVRQRSRDIVWEHNKSVLVLVGQMTITWAGISLMLNTLIEWHHHASGQAFRKDMPRDFTQKLKYLEKLEQTTFWTPKDRAQITAIRLELANLNRFRVNMAHGLLHRTGSIGSPWKVHVAKEEQLGLARQTLVYSDADLRDQSRRMAEISHEISPFFAGLIGLPHPANR